MVSVSPGDKKEQLGHFSQSWETRGCARPRPPPGRLPACPVRDVPRRRCLLRAVRSLPRLCGHSHTRTPRSCPLWPAHRRVGNTAPTEKEGDRKPRGVRFCQVRLEAPTLSPEPRNHALPQTYGVSHPRARGKARPKLRALRIRPGGRLAPWLRRGLPSGLSLRLQAAAAAARPKDAGKREGTVSGGGPRTLLHRHPPLPLWPAPHRAWTEISPCRRRAWTSGRALRCTSEVQSPGRVESDS